MSDQNQDYDEMEQRRLMFLEEMLRPVPYDLTNPFQSSELHLHQEDVNPEDGTTEEESCSDISFGSLEQDLSLDGHENGILLTRPLEISEIRHLRNVGLYPEREQPVPYIIQPIYEHREGETQPLLHQGQRVDGSCEWPQFLFYIIMICKYFHTYLNLLYT